MQAAACIAAAAALDVMATHRMHTYLQVQRVLCTSEQRIYGLEPAAVALAC